MALSIRNSLHGTINKYKILVLQDTIDISGTLLPSGTIIVMGGTGTAKLAYTVNGGTSWTAVSLFSTSGQAIAYGLQRLVAVGQGGNTLITSANGTTWTTVVSPFSTIGYDVLFDGTKWISVGQGGATLAYSGIGGSWTSVSGIFTTAGYGLLYDSANQLYFAAGEGGNTLATSSDGVIWTGSSPLKTRAYSVGGPATYSGGQTVTIGGWVATSSTSSLIATSVNGIGWSSNNASAAISNPYQVDYGIDGSSNPVWLAGSSGIAPYKLGYSYNKTTWNGITPSDTSTYSCNFLTYSLDNSNNPLWVATAGGYIIKSSNMFNWSGLTTTFSVSPNKIRWFQRPTSKMWFIVGYGTYNIAYSTDISYGSTNANWTYVTPTLFSSSARCIEYGLDGAGSELFIVGGNGGNNYAKSSNGINWTGYTNALISDIYAIGFGKDGANNNLWVAGGYGTSNTIIISSNGTDWTGKGMVFSVQCTSVKYVNNIWVAVGRGTTTIAYSTNGSNWTTVSSSATILPATSWTDLTYGSTTYTKPKYLSAGQGNQTLMGSTDGTTWYALPSPFTTAAKSVAWSAALSRWVAVGEGTNTIAWSDDGVNWTGLGTTYFATRGNKVKYDSTTSKFYAVGEGTNRLVSSSDGKTWTAISTTGAVTTAGIGVCLV